MLARIRKSLDEKDQGFTLIELLVVIIIIGILAAIAIPVFLNQRQKAAEASMKSDLRTVAEELETVYTDNQAYYTVATTGSKATIAATPAQDVQLSPNNAVAGKLVGTTGYCLTATNTKFTGVTWYYNSTTGGLTKTACP